MKNKGTLIKVVAVVALILAIIGGIVISMLNAKKAVAITSSELARAMNYRQVEEGDEAIDGTENVQFSAFFLRDLDGDGYAEKIEGTCRPIGEEDTLYMEIQVVTEGYLKDAKIQIAGKNFYLQTVIPKDEQLLNNYIGNNSKLIEFNQLNSGTQKLLTGKVRSGDYSYGSTKASAIGNNINNYSREDNKIILTGTYVGADYEEVEIVKEIPLTVDWYGTTNAEIYGTYQTRNDLPTRINEEEGTLKLSFNVETHETKDELNLSRNYVEGTIPSLNEYAPIEVKMLNADSSNLIFTYDQETKKFTIDRTAKVQEDGTILSSVSDWNSYNIEVIYPIDAYKSLGEDVVSISIPVQTYYEGFNNPNEEFKNPYKSNTAGATIVANYENPREYHSAASFSITVGRYQYYPVNEYVVSKQKPMKIYNGISEEEKDDTYIVRWDAYTGTDGESSGLVMKETKNGEGQVSDRFIKTNAEKDSMENITSNVGIYFTGTESLLKEDGWIKIYDDETDNLIVTFTKEEAREYTSYKPYKYELPVKHIRIETSETNKESSLYVYNIKELNDEYITTNYTREEFDNLKYIESTLNGYLGESHIRTSVARAKYEEPYSFATIHISKNIFSTQETQENVRIEISTDYDPEANQVGWTDGSFLVKLPKEILTAEINNVRISNSNVEITTYEIVETDEGKFIKINTKNKNNVIPAYIITIDTNLTPDPRIGSKTGTIELYAANNEEVEYCYPNQDIYDVNDNLDSMEMINKTSIGIQIIAPNTLLTNQTASEYDDKNSMVVSPEIAEITPKYAKVDNEKQTAKIGIQLKNNHELTTSEIKILGKIPFEGNTTVISGRELGSEFTAKMLDAGIVIPEELQGKVTVYYSEKENPTTDLADEENRWKTQENVTDWGNIKTFFIDFENETMPAGKEYTLYYEIEIPEGIEFNKTAFSHHGIYFCLNTEEGKYRTQVEANKIGFGIVEKFDLEIIKTQTGKDKLVPGATYSVREVTEEGTVIDEKTAVTNAEGTLLIKNLYAERIYEVLEIKTPKDYELSEDVIQFIGHVDEEGTLTIERLQGETKEDILVTKNEGEMHKVTLKVEDEAKATLKITKKEFGSETVLRNVKFKVTGKGLPANGRILTTNVNGEINLRGLQVNEEYRLEEMKVEGYYLENPITFKIINNEGIYTIEITEGSVAESTIIEEDSLPVANITIENEKIPRYTLEINKIKRELETELTTDGTAGDTTGEKEIVYLEGAKFKLYKGTKELGSYTTGPDGKVAIENLYQYVEGREEEAIYTLKEVLTPAGYAKVKDITFKVQEIEGTLTLINIEGKEQKYTSEEGIVKLTIEDSPSFKLIKKDAETGEVLANVKFAIYNIDGAATPAVNSKGEIIGTKEVINGIEYYTVTTDENGTITVDLPEGFYKAVEVQAPDKYDIKDSTYFFGIGGSRETKTKLKVDSMNIIEADWSTTAQIVKTRDGGYIVVGKNEVAKYSSDNVEEWIKIINRGNDTIFTDIDRVIETTDGSYIVEGHSSFGCTLEDGTTLDAGVMIIKYDSTGELQWAKSISQFSELIPLETDDGGCIAFGKTSTYYDPGDGYNIDLGNGVILSGDGQEAWIIKFSSNGEAEEAKKIETIGYGNLMVQKANDGGYIVGVNNNIGKIIKYNENFEMEWTETILLEDAAGAAQVKSILKTEDGGFIVGGSVYGDNIGQGHENQGGEDAFLIKYSSNGEVEWSKGFGGTGDDIITSITLINDGGYIVQGTFYSDSIELDNGTILLNGGDDLDSDGQPCDRFLIKYRANGEIEWIPPRGEGVNIHTVCATEAGGFMLKGGFDYKFDLGNGIYASGHTIVKYNSKCEPQFAEELEGWSDGYAIEEISPGNYILAHADWREDIISVTKYVEVEDPVNIVKGFVANKRISYGKIAETKDEGYIIWGDYRNPLRRR